MGAGCSGCAQLKADSVHKRSKCQHAKADMPQASQLIILPAPSAATSAGPFRGAKAQVKTCVLAGSTPVQRGEAESVPGSMGISWARRPRGTAIQAIPRHLPKHFYVLPVNICIRSNLLHTVPALVYRPDFGTCGPVHQNEAITHLPHMLGELRGCHQGLDLRHLF